MENYNFNFEQRKNPRIINKNLQQVIELRKEIQGNQLGDKVLGKIVDYSLGGWGLILTTKFPPKITDVYYLNLEQLNSKLKLLRVQVKWCKQLDNETFKIGVQSIKHGF